MSPSLAVGPDYGFGLYLHWPYCQQICPYCDFNVYAAKHRDTAPLFEAMLEDIRRHAALLPDHPALDSLFFGGGTPSLMSVAQIARVIETAASTFGLSPNCEISLEANPNDIAGRDLSGWLSAGVNRISLGVQSFDDNALTFLGRSHSRAEALTAIETVQKRFSNHSIDLIYALPGQSLSDWQAQLERAFSLGVPHLSLYELTIEPSTVFGKRHARGTLQPMPDDQQADLYEITQARCDAAGLPAYEVSNHARDVSYQAKHNLIYWNSGDWLGIGPGAHGRLSQDGQRWTTQAARRPQAYIEASQPERVALAPNEVALEYLAMSLRPLTGLSLTRYHSLFGQRPDPDVRQSLEENALIQISGDQLCLTLKGRLLADYVASRLA